MEVWQLACVVCAVVGAAAYVGIDLKAIRRSTELIEEMLDEQARRYATTANHAKPEYIVVHDVSVK